MAAVRYPFPVRFVASGAAGVALLLVTAAAEAAVVQGLHVDASATTTRIVVEVDGDFRYRTHPGPGSNSVLVDIEAATLGAQVPRVVPVSDARVNGVLVREDPASGGVRLSVDIEGRRSPQLSTAIDGTRLLLTFVDAGAARPTAAPAPPSRPAAAAKAAPNSTAGKASAPAVATASSLRPSVAERPLVVLDPGHGGKDPGARAWTGEYEKDIVLDLAERVARRLRKGGEVDVVLTRSGDSYVSLPDRREASRRWGADVFVSIHANASPRAGVRGIETYYRSRSGDPGKDGGADRETRRLARLENGGRQARGRSPAKGAVQATSSSAAPPLLDRRAESLRLARLVQGELVSRLGMRYEAVHDLGVKEGPFFVLGENAAPSVLVEAAFLTHREEGLRMRSEVYREQIADGVARGIRAFLEQQRRAGAL